MDQANVLNFKKRLSESNNILIVLPEFVNTDTISAASVLYSFITSTLKKKTIIGASAGVPERFGHILEICGVNEEHIISEIRPLQYVVKVNNTENDLEIAVDRQGNNVDIIMIPKKTEIDLGNISLTTIGHKFDMFIFINVIDPIDAGSLYSKNKDLYKKDNSIVITTGKRFFDNLEVLYSKENNTVSENIYQILEIFGVSLNHAMKEVLFEGMVLGTDGLHRMNTFKTLELLPKLTQQSELQSKFNELFYSYSLEGLDLRKKIYGNLRNKENLIYSELTEEDLNNLGIKGEQLDGIDFLPFGIVEDFDTYMMAYSYKGKKKFLIESKNNEVYYNKLRNIYKIIRSNNIISFETNDSAEEVVNKLIGNIGNSNLEKNVSNAAQSSTVQNTEPPMEISPEPNQSNVIYTNESTSSPFTSADSVQPNPEGNPFRPLEK